MITKTKHIGYDETGKAVPVCDFFGKSTDSKPTDSSVGNGSFFLEIDTGELYIFDGEAKVWCKQ